MKKNTNINENELSSASQNKMILEYLQKGYSITPLTALKLFGSLRLGARIFDLREKGYNIKTERVATHTGKYVASYSLIND